MRRFWTIALVAAAAATVTITTGGSAYAGGTQAPTVAPATSQYNSDVPDELMGGCHRRAHLSDSANPIDG